jgi:hypothetical protein
VAGPSDITVYVGSTKAYKGQQYAVKDVAVNRDFSRNAKINDIALLTLESSLEFTDWIGPACLPTKSARQYIGQDLTVSGWGYISHDEKETNDLKVIKDIKILYNCRE